METMPMPLAALSAGLGGLDEFRVTAPREIASMLRQLCEGNVRVNLNASDGSVVGATIWSMDAERGEIGFDVDHGDPALHPLMVGRGCVVIGYLDSVKLQFEVTNPVLVRASRASVLSCNYPRELFRFQRRNAYRVRPLLRSMPVARLRHTDIADMLLTLRVLDVSIGGCALLVPSDVPPLQIGGVVDRGEIDLDSDTQLQVGLRLQNVTSLDTDSRGVRLGCEFVRADAATLRVLQRFIDLTQKRGKMLSMD